MYRADYKEATASCIVSHYKSETFFWNHFFRSSKTCLAKVFLSTVVGNDINTMKTTVYFNLDWIKIKLVTGMDTHKPRSQENLYIQKASF